MLFLYLFILISIGYILLPQLVDGNPENKQGFEKPALFRFAGEPNGAMMMEGKIQAERVEAPKEIPDQPVLRIQPHR